MIVKALIEMLQKVDNQYANVFLKDSTTIQNECTSALLVRDLNDDEFVVVLTTD